LALVAAPATALARPWEAREPAVEPKPAHQLRNPATWPAEPETPTPIDAAKFAASWAYLCGVAPDSATAALAPKILAAATAAKSDPFTLAALARFGSKCDPAYKGKGGTYGLLAIEPGMYRMPPRRSCLWTSRMTSKRLLDPEVNLAVGAALLEMWNLAQGDRRRVRGGRTAAASRISLGRRGAFEATRI
jgi:hypothetical protein